MSETVQDRAAKFWHAYANGEEYKQVRDLLAEFGEAERVRAVEECAEAAKDWWHGRNIVPQVCRYEDSRLGLALRALIAPPVPVWCEHIMYDKVPTANGPKLWYLLYQKSERCTAWDGSECPICGAPKPEVAK